MHGLPCENILQRIEARLDDLSVRWERNNTLLEEHMRRTELLEAAVKPLEKDMSRTKTVLYVVVLLAGGTGLFGAFGERLIHLVAP